MSTIIATDSPPPAPQQQQLPELIQALEQATHMAKELPLTVANTAAHRHIFAALHSAHLSLSSFLSAVGAGDEGDPMQVGDGEEENSMDGVEEKMREVYIQNKRAKRALSPAVVAAAEQRRVEENESGVVVAGFNPVESRLRKLDLVYQFHA